MGVSEGAPFTLVLGGGGVPGAAYLIGALEALADTGLVEPSAASLIIGTSAGARIGALLATGVPIAALQTETFPIGGDYTAGPLLDRAWTTQIELGRRLAGASWVLARSVVQVPFPAPPPVLGRLFPGGLNILRDRDRVTTQYAGGWPDTPLWLTAVDLGTGRRVVLSRRATGDMGLAGAVTASMAVPGVFDPVRFEHRVMVDGGIHSTTNLDLARWVSPRQVICLAPMGFDPLSPPAIRHRATRSLVNAQIVQEVAVVRASGRQLLLLRPDADVLALHGLNLLRPCDTDAIVAASRRATSQALGRPGARTFLERLDSQPHSTGERSPLHTKEKGSR
jgi:NTE family protein